MTNKTYIKKLKELLKNSDNELEKDVIADLLEAESVDGYLNNLLQHGCVSGMVNKLIWHSDTKEYYIKYMEEIGELKEELEESMGEPLKMGTPMFNWLAWFGYEETARKIADKLGIEI